ncbi:hypothetical protein F3Y22_tig00111812pilonHSYRG00278 [Hibiscus syriacus]|uniref:CCHC-type domain-containing protein n=1 Tax=Hibiscus syriacus TaxID=106335 RepID=A0A6A2YCN6_HIBSY|nr:hypothetical protein F3Y22_tig00111812pilonHSYRG00278 [Hibiscus syriacus]
MNFPDISSAIPSESVGNPNGMPAIRPPGWPPDGSNNITTSVSLERPGGDITVEDLPVGKKARSHEALPNPVEVEEPVVGSDGLDEIMKDTSVEGNIPQPPKPSFKYMVTRQNGSNNTVSLISDLDVELLDGDVQFGMDGLIPDIPFSEMIYQAIADKLSKSVIVRLLGKSIGYRALLNHNQTLWYPVGEIDLDNEYFLVRFAVEGDYHRVFSGGPWMIYGSYLTVQPFVKEFLNLEDHPKKILVWLSIICLGSLGINMPYRYYTKSLFRAIAGALGAIVRVDYNTTVGWRGRFARLAVVVDLDKPLVPGLMIDGKYQNVEYEGLPTICYACGKYGHTKASCLQPTRRRSGDKNKGERRIKETRDLEMALRRIAEPSSSGSNKMEIGMQNGTFIRKQAVNVEKQQEGNKEVIVADTKEKMVHVQSDLNKNKHNTIRIINEETRDIATGGKQQEGDKEVIVADPKEKRVQVPSVQSMNEHVANRSTNVDRREALRDRNDIFAMFEPRVSGAKADEFIRKSGFDRSFRIEANGFSGGIWVMWKEFVAIYFLLPDGRYRKKVWDQLRALDLNSDTPWLLGGDFNAICGTQERSGGSLRRCLV